MLATQGALVLVGMALALGAERVAADSVYVQPAVGTAGVALVLVAVGRQLVVTLDGERRAKHLQREVRERTDELAARDQRFRSLVETSSDVIWILDATGLVTFVTPSAERVLGYEPPDCEGQVLWAFVHGDDHGTVRDALAAAVAGADASAVEWRMRRSDGEWAYCESTLRSLLDDESVGGVVVNMRDISERKHLEQQLLRRALHDPLTGLANATLFRDRAELATARAQRGTACALLLVDLDDFKAVNDGLGHAAGDQVLINVARRLVQAVRPGDTVARLGGDEFAVLLDGHRELAPDIVAARIQEALREPMLVDGHEIFAPASIGLATSEFDADAEALLRNADAAMYIAKGKGKSQTEVFRPEMHTHMKHRLTLATELRRAVSAGQLALRYQPIVDLKTCRVVGFEALVRWRHPERGLVMPGEFIPLAENTGTIVALGRWVFEEACAAMAGLHSVQHATEAKVYLTVNLSPRQFLDRNLVRDLVNIANAAGAAARNLTLEL
ncbi:MAG TPA: diguanylate cyclase, partial [Acidimicrobiales bacterium]|nr:diguanylate cyclase [Acidimicrobiales bacterium]